LLPLLGKDDLDRRVIINSIGHVWDGNEVWLLTAGGATFAAFPLWYASVFSGFYLALFLMLAALIIRGVAFEYRHLRPESSWAANWDKAIFIGSLVPALLWGVAFADFLHGVPVLSNGNFTGTFFDLVKPYALVGGVSTLLLFTLYGTTYLALKTDGDVRVRARELGQRLAPLTFVVMTAFMVWTFISQHSAHRSGIIPPFVPVLGLLLLASVGWLIRDRLEGWAFTATALTVAILFLTVFTDLYPNVLISSISPANTLSIVQTASHPYTLKVMTWVAVIFTPFVLAYQGWTYWVFRQRVTRPTGDVTASRVEHA
jgi:cytochrome d ubiquinol oxidase subunit II